MDLMADQRNVVSLAKRLWIAKLSLRTVSIILCLITTGCCVAKLDITLIHTLLPPLVPLFSWNIAEGITLVRRRAGYNGINPGACVGVDLILWLGLMTAVLFLAPGFGYKSAYYTPEQKKPLFYVSMGFGFLTLFVQIALFGIACNETDRSRKARRLHKASLPHSPACN